MLHQNCQDVDPADMRPRVGTVTVGSDDVERRGWGSWARIKCDFWYESLIVQV